jgi:DNA repair ATPase RecN
LGESITHLHDRRLRKLEDQAIKSRISALDIFYQTKQLMDEIRAHDIKLYEQLMGNYEKLKSEMDEFTDLFQDSQFDRKTLDAFLQKHGLLEQYKSFYEKRKMNAVYYRARKKQRSEMMV